MIKFFRKIRQRLLTENKFSKYILYAMGEILLVMIGILLALQVNNWNEYRKARQLEQTYLKRLQTDLMTDTAYLKQRILNSESVKQSNYSYVHAAHKNNNLDKNLRDYLSLPIFNAQDLTLQNTTYLELVNTAKIDLISNENLKIKVINLYRTYEVVDKQMEEINAFTTDLWREWNKKVVNIKYRNYLADLFDESHMFYPKEREWFNNPESFEFRLTENTVGWYYAKHKGFIDDFNALLNDIEDVLSSLEIELDSK